MTSVQIHLSYMYLDLNSIGRVYLLSTNESSHLSGFDSRGKQNLINQVNQYGLDVHASSKEPGNQFFVEGWACWNGDIAKKVFFL